MRLLLNFYKSFAISSCLITIVCVVLLFLHGLEPFFTIFWFKVITEFIIIYIINFTKKPEFYFYKNLGLSKTKLWSLAMGLDGILFLLLTILSLIVR